MSGKPGVVKGALHSRNRHQGRYDFEKLKVAHPDLCQFVAQNKYGDASIDFTNPEAVKALNRALLQDYYGIRYWDIPAGFLCPPIPGRADYIHNLADLLIDQKGQISRGSQVRILDLGVGANCIYPIIGTHEYGWSYVGADINPLSIQNAKAIVEQNQLSEKIELRLQKDSSHLFVGMIKAGERFDATTCNPPFHASMEEAQSGSRRKWKNLGKGHEKQSVNFGGQGAELWCEGGELAFIRKMIEESVQFYTQVRWFSTLVSKEETIPKVESALKKCGARSIRILEMEQGQKKSRVLAWSYVV